MTTKPKTDTSVGTLVGQAAAACVGVVGFMLVAAGVGASAGIAVRAFMWAAGL